MQGIGDRDFRIPIVDLFSGELVRFGGFWSKVDLGRVELGRLLGQVVSIVQQGRVRSNKVNGRELSGRPRSIASRRGWAVFFGRFGLTLFWPTNSQS